MSQSSSPAPTFVEVNTETDLLPNSTPSSPPFTSVLTDESIIEFGRPYLEPDHLIHLYDETFKTQEEFQKFVTTKLAPWRNLAELKLFTLQYNHQRATQREIKRKRQQAQELLEEANRMQKYHDQQQEEFYRSIDHMNQYGL